MKMFSGSVRYLERSLNDLDLFPGRAEIEFSGKDFHFITYLVDIETRSPVAQQFGQEALVLRRKVLHKDDREPEILRQYTQETLQRVETSCRGAYDDNRESIVIRCHVWLHTACGMLLAKINKRSIDLILT
jgi:hypothetical protein